MNETLAVTALDQPVAAYLAHQRALGRGYDNEQRVLDALRGFIAHSSAAELNATLFDRWCETLGHLNGNTRRARQRIVRKFCLYRQRSEPNCFVPNDLYFARGQPYVTPILVEPCQISRMLAAADKQVCTPGSPLLPAVLRIAVVLLYTAGIRRGELLRLTLADVVPGSGALRIRESKFHKSRWVALSPSARSELTAYLRKRLAKDLDAQPDAPLLCNRTRGLRAYTGTGISRGLHALFEAAGIEDSAGHRPRIHDIRHSFAVQALIRWYRQGADVQSNLPKLALYMGHVSIASTAYYLRFVPSIAHLASERFEKGYGEILKEMRP